MKKIYWIVAVVVVVLLAGFYYAEKGSSYKQNSPIPTVQNKVPQQESNTSSVTVMIRNFSFSPQMTTVKVGQTVTWTNQDGAIHTINSATFNSGNLSNGQSFSHKFDTAGSFAYSCGIHPSMTGTIIVQ